MQRYDLVQVSACYTTDHEMERADDGEWVRYEDIANLIAALQSIANNSCCGPCLEAKRVAAAALAPHPASEDK